MGWGQNPIEQAAADRAAAAAVEQAERKPLTPFERKLLGLIEDVRDAFTSQPVSPLLVTVDPSTPPDLLARIDKRLPAGSVITGPNGPILDVRLISAARPSLAPLLDADPGDMGAALDAAEMAIAAVYGDATGPTGYRRLAESAIQAALDALVEADLDRHFQTSPGQEAAGGGAAGGGVGGEGSTLPVTPPAGHPATN